MGWWNCFRTLFIIVLKSGEVYRVCLQSYLELFEWILTINYIWWVLKTLLTLLVYWMLVMGMLFLIRLSSANFSISFLVSVCFMLNQDLNLFKMDSNFWILLGFQILCSFGCTWNHANVFLFSMQALGLGISRDRCLKLASWVTTASKLGDQSYLLPLHQQHWHHAQWTRPIFWVQ